MKKRNRVLALVMCFLFAFATPLLCMTVSAAEVSGFEGHISESKVMNDLKTMKVENENGEFVSFEQMGFAVKFNGDGSYTETPQSGVDYLEMIAFYEYGYSKEKGANDPNYGVYLYIYNPSGRALKKDGRHVANMAVAVDADGTVTKRKNIDLELVSASENNMFLKFRVDPEAAPFPMNLVKVNGTKKRVYELAGIDLQHTGGSKDYAIGSSVVCSGYREDNTFTSKKGDKLVVDLQCYSTWYRLSTSASGEYHYANLDSVYFSIPERLEEQYGQLTSIEAEWYEYTTAPILYFKNKSDYDKYSKYSNSFDYDKYGYYARDGWRTFPVTGMNSDVKKYFEVICPVVYWGVAGTYYTPKIVGDSGLKSIYDAYGNAIDGEQFLDNMRTITSNVVDRLNLNAGGILGDFYDRLDLYTENGLYKGLVSSADEGRTTGYNHVFVGKDDVLTLTPFEGSGWEKFLEYGFSQPEEFGDVESFRAIESLATFDEETDPSSWGINVGDAAKIAAFVDRAKKQDRVPYIYRFAVTDYEFGEAFLWDCNNKKSLCDEGDLYYSRQTIYCDFDILSLGFSKTEGEAVIETRIPVINDKQDITSDPTTGTETENIIIVGAKDIIWGAAGFALDLTESVVDGVFDVLFGDFADAAKTILMVIVGLVVLFFVIWFIKFLLEWWRERKNKQNKK